MVELETKVKLLEKEIHDRKGVFQRLDIAIEKLADVSNAINRMLAVHEEKIARQEEAIFEAEGLIETRRIELTTKIDDLHSRITTNTKEIMNAATQQHKEHTDDIQKLRNDLTTRVGILEKWRHVLIGGSIILGFIAQKFIEFGS
jgi:chromosome segregation ATPase